MFDSIKSRIGCGAILMATLFTGCVTEPTGKQDDSALAITTEMAGMALKESFGRMQDWNLAAAPALASLQTSPSLDFDTKGQGSGLGKRASDNSEALTVDYSDTAKGLLRIAHEKREAGRNTLTTLVLRYDEAAKDDIEDNENVIRLDVRVERPGGKLETLSITDADGDGLVKDHSKESSLVRVELEAFEPADKPEALHVHATAILEVLHSGGDKPVTFAYDETLKNGRTNRIRLLNRHGGEEMIPGDTLELILTSTATAASDSLKDMTMTLVMNPGQDLKDNEDDSLYAVQLLVRKNLGAERAMRFDFVSRDPILHGDEPVAGTFHLEVEYAGGGEAILDGEFAEDRFEAHFTGAEGEKVAVSYDKAGHLLASVSQP